MPFCWINCSFDEKLRVEREGGFIQYDMVNGDISVSRSFGTCALRASGLHGLGYWASDQAYKCVLRAGDIDPKTGRKILGLTSEPEIKSFHLTEEDEFLLIACDGLWDVMKPENSVTLARCVAAFA